MEDTDLPTIGGPERLRRLKRTGYTRRSILFFLWKFPNFGKSSPWKTDLSAGAVFCTRGPNNMLAFIPNTASVLVTDVLVRGYGEHPVFRRVDHPLVPTKTEQHFSGAGPRPPRSDANRRWLLSSFFSLNYSHSAKGTLTPCPVFTVNNRNALDRSTPGSKFFCLVPAKIGLQWSRKVRFVTRSN